MGRRYGYYWSRLAHRRAGAGALVAAMVWLGNSWFQLVVAALLGVLLTQFGFLGHDAAHRQMFVSPAWNEWTARIISGAGVGLSYGGGGASTTSTTPVPTRRPRPRRRDRRTGHHPRGRRPADTGLRGWCTPARGGCSSRC